MLGLNMISDQGLVRTGVITILTSPISVREVFLHFGVDDEVQIYSKIVVTVTVRRQGDTS